MNKSHAIRNYHVLQVAFLCRSVLLFSYFFFFSNQGGISSSVLSVFFTDKFALSQSDARISVAYNSCQ